MAVGAERRAIVLRRAVWSERWIVFFPIFLPRYADQIIIRAEIRPIPQNGIRVDFIHPIPVLIFFLT